MKQYKIECKSHIFYIDADDQYEAEQQFWDGIETETTRIDTDSNKVEFSYEGQHLHTEIDVSNDYLDPEHWLTIDIEEVE